MQVGLHINSCRWKLHDVAPLCSINLAGLKPRMTLAISCEVKNKTLGIDPVLCYRYTYVPVFVAASLRKLKKKQTKRAASPTGGDHPNKKEQEKQTDDAPKRRRKKAPQ